MRNKISLTTINDPGHGWLVVSHDLVKELGIEVSSFSYMTHDKVYLEEDSDASKALHALHQHGYNIDIKGSPYWAERNVADNPKVVKLKETYTDNEAKCRSYASYRADQLGLWKVGHEFMMAYGSGIVARAKIIGEAANKGRTKTLFHVEVTYYNGVKKRFYIPKIKALLYIANDEQVKSFETYEAKHQTGEVVV